jgi:hypothetical protein
MSDTKSSRTRSAVPRGDVAAEERTWVAVPDPAPGATEPIYVSFSSPPDAEALAEAASQVATLEANCQISRGGESTPPGATHVVERDAVGHRRLVRKRFSARR